MSICCHVGPGALGITCVKKISSIIKKCGVDIYFVCSVASAPKSHQNKYPPHSY